MIEPLMCDYERLTDTGGADPDETGSGSDLLPGINMTYLREFLNGTADTPWNVTVDSFPVVQGIPAGMCGSLNVSIAPEGPVSGEYFLLIIAQSVFHDHADQIGFNVSVDGSTGGDAIDGGNDDDGGDSDSDDGGDDEKVDAGESNDDTNGSSDENDVMVNLSTMMRTKPPLPHGWCSCPRSADWFSG